MAHRLIGSTLPALLSPTLFGGTVLLDNGYKDHPSATRHLATVVGAGYPRPNLAVT